MATPKLLQDAATMCKTAGIAVPAEPLDIKARSKDESEEGESEEGESEEDESEEEESDDEDVYDPYGTGSAAKGRPQMSITMAEYLVTDRCLVEVLDREFNNPAHTPCYDVGGCYNCKRNRKHAEDQVLLAAGQVPTPDPVELDIQQRNAEAEEVKARAREAAKRNERSEEEFQVFMKAIGDWREDYYMQIVNRLNICLAALMTGEELVRVAKFKITSIESFNHPQVRWEAPLEWRQALLEFIKDLEESEASKRGEAHRIQEEKAQGGGSELEQGRVAERGTESRTEDVV